MRNSLIYEAQKINSINSINYFGFFGLLFSKKAKMKILFRDRGQPRGALLPYTNDIPKGQFTSWEQTGNAGDEWKGLGSDSGTLSV